MMLDAMPAGLAIRPLQADDDLAALTRLVHAAYAPHAAKGLHFVGTHQSVEETARRFASGHGLLLTRDGTPIGTVIARPPQPDSAALPYRDPYTWSVSQLAVHPTHAGRGLGRRLHDAAMAVAAGHGAITMALDTAAPAHELIALYRRWGYRIVGRVDWRPSTNYESVVMARPIAPAGR